MEFVGMWLDSALFAQSRQQLPAAGITVYPQGSGPNTTSVQPTHVHRTTVNVLPAQNVFLSLLFSLHANISTPLLI